MKFSVLMSVYHKENPFFLSDSLNSVYKQTVKPTEIVLVQDGPLTEELYAIIENWRRKLNIIDVVIPCNVGLGEALNQGLQHCSYELVARMDTDDLALENRFEKQLAIFQSHDIDICGSWVSEFDDDSTKILSYRKVAELHVDILKSSSSVNPMNHPAVMYKKSKIQQCGSYESVIFFEDYYLWLKLLNSGSVFYNIQEPLVNMRAGSSQLSRRRGFNYLKKEFSFYLLCYKKGYFPWYIFILNVSIRSPIRIMPRFIVSLVYSVIRRF